MTQQSETLEDIIARVRADRERLNTPRKFLEVEDFPPGRGYVKIVDAETGLVLMTGVTRHRPCT
jgi:hypothetical protein